MAEDPWDMLFSALVAIGIVAALRRTRQLDERLTKLEPKTEKADA